MNSVQIQQIEARKAVLQRMGVRATPNVPVVRKPPPLPPSPRPLSSSDKLLSVPVRPDDTDLWLFHGVKPPSPRVLAARMLHEVAEEFNVEPEDILGRRRKAVLVFPRHVLIHRLAKQFPTWSYPRLGRAIGREHTTIMYVLGKLKKKPKILAEVIAAA